MLNYCRRTVVRTILQTTDSAGRWLDDDDCVRAAAGAAAPTGLLVVIKLN